MKPTILICAILLYCGVLPEASLAVIALILSGPRLSRWARYEWESFRREQARQALHWHSNLSAKEAWEAMWGGGAS